MATSEQNLQELLRNAGFTPRTSTTDTQEEEDTKETPKAGLDEETQALLREAGFTPKGEPASAPKKEGPTEEELEAEQQRQREGVAMSTGLPATDALTEEQIQTATPEVEGAFPTTREGLYYSGPEGQRLKEREQQLRSKLMGPGGTGEFTQITGGLSPEEEKELADIEAAKQQRYESIQGDKITDLGPLGKFATDETGATTFIPGPNSTEAGDVYRKMASDSLRGILGLPELAGFEGFQDVIPKVNSENEAVIVLSEIGQFSFGAYGGFKAAQKLPKLGELVQKSPAFAAFAETLPQNLRNLAYFTAQGAVTIGQKAVPAGTISSGMGALVTADEDVATFFGGEDMSMAEAKLRVLQDALTVGGVFKAVGAGPSVIAGIPLVKSAALATKDALALLFAGQSKIDQQIARKLGEYASETLTDLKNAKTPEEVTAAQEKLFGHIDEAMKNKTGLSYEEWVVREYSGKNADDLYIPNLGELLGDQQLMRIYNGLRLKRGEKKADQLLADALGKNQQQRIDAIKAQAKTAREELAPTGREAAETVEAEVAGPAVRREEELLTEMEAAQRGEVTAAREAAAEEVVRGPARVQEEVAEIAGDVQTTLEQSRISQRNINTINNLVDDTGEVTPINDVLRADLNEKTRLGTLKDDALADIEITPEEAVGIADDLLAKFSSEDFIKADIDYAKGYLSKFLRIFRAGDDVVEPVAPIPPTGPTPTPGPAPTPTPVPKGPIQTQLDELQRQLDEATTAQEILEISQKIRALLKGKPKKAIADTAPQEIEELPSITALDLEFITMSARDLATKAKKASTSTTAGSAQKRTLAKVGQNFTKIADDLTTRLDDYVATSTQAMKAREDFNLFFGDFKNRWRSSTGRDWQEELIDARTVPDMAGVVEKIAKMVANPNMGAEDFAQVRGIVSQMAPETRAAFAENLQNRVLLDFMPNGLQVADTPMKTVGQAEQVLRQLNSYLTGTQKYQQLLPEAVEPLARLRNQLTDLVVPFRDASQRAKTAQERAAIQSQLLDTKQMNALNDITNRVKQAEKTMAKSAVQKLTAFEGEPAQYFIRILDNKQTGPKEIKELWTRAGMVGEKGEDGLTSAQRAVQESFVEALLRKSYTPVEEGVDSGRIGLKYLEEMMNSKSAVGKMLNTVMQGNQPSKELLTRLTNMARSFREAEGAGFVQGSATAEKTAFTNALMDVQTVIFGPLTQRARFARFLTRIGMNVTNLDERLANAYAKVLTRPDYAKMVLDYAADAKRKGVMPEEKATSDMMLRLLMAESGYGEYLEATRGDDGSLLFRIEDPIKDLIRRAESMVVEDQMDEMLPPDSPATPE